MREVSSKIIFALAIFVMCLGLNIIVPAQTVTGTIKGNVVDTAEAIVPGVSIEIVNIETGLKRNIVTNDDGYYQVTFLPIGSYTVTASKSGFGTVVRENI